MRITFLGSADAFCAGGNHQAAYLVEAGGSACLLDCGATTLGGLKRHGIDASRIDAVALSHLHGDHFAGLPFLFLEYIYETPRTRPLDVAGPPGTAERVSTLFQTMYRRTGMKPLPFELRFAELLPQQSRRFG
ncbi:MAG TPA: MBL fold metallo-hydrolase, partial [Candidatus Acidoferrales bacterium]|nr:MBL fold metallo-hydrolase [Candidatus Acidoferrales bacterium]